MGESLEEQCRRLKLTEPEDLNIQLDSDEESTQAKGDDLLLVGKLLTNTPFNMEALGKTMEKVWKLGRGVECKPLGKQLMLFKFAHIRDLTRVLEGGPWNFDKHILLLGKYQSGSRPSDVQLTKAPFWIRINDLPPSSMTKKVGETIGNAIGRVLEVDVDHEGRAWGPFMKLRVELDVRNPLRRGVFLTLNKKTGKEWFSFQYERLPNYCYSCGLLEHTDSECIIEKEEDGMQQYGDWLRAPNDRWLGRRMNKERSKDATSSSRSPWSNVLQTEEVSSKVSKSPSKGLSSKEKEEELDDATHSHQRDPDSGSNPKG